MRPLRDVVGDIIWQVTPGAVTTYGDVARALGDIVAARAVAAMTMDDLDPEEFPTHRVVRKDGTLGGHPLGEGEKARRLAEEGIAVEDGRVTYMADLRQMFFRSDLPLKQLRKQQTALGMRLNLGPMGTPPRTILGVDVAYSRDGHAFASAIAVDALTLKITGTRFHRSEVTFPYIPTYLAFQEMPAIEAVLEGLDLEDSLLMVDGQGILHPRGFGIACHIGVSLGIPTVGVAKRMLTGSYDRAALRNTEQAAVMIEGEHRGWALAPKGREKKAVFASPGHMVSVEDALRLVRDSMGRRQPRPLELAHAAATAARREWDAHSTMSS